jgi:ATP-dependent Zn protease
MGSDPQNWVSVLINWFPMLLLIAVWIWVMKRWLGGKNYASKFQRDYMDRMTEQNKLLERIATALERESRNG